MISRVFAKHAFRNKTAELARWFARLSLLSIVSVFAYLIWEELRPSPANLREIREAVLPRLTRDLQKVGLEVGSDIHIRIFKESRELELWVQRETKFVLFRTYEICNYSGALGPKLKEGDRQSPEGFYKVGLAQMNPNSSYHLSFNLGFPNKFDQENGRTGSFLMVHGDCVSIGCYAMIDDAIEEIYLLAEAALNAGQGSFQVHAFPFRMENRELSGEWAAFWGNLKTGHD